MGNGGIIVFIIVIIIGFHFMNGGTIDDLRNFDFKFSKSVPEKKVTKIIQETKEQSEEKGANVTTSSNESTICNFPNYGLPDYDGTGKEGDFCTDALPLERDSECLSNPPKRYGGSINTIVGTSNPELGCCEDDGLCHWKDEVLY